MYSVLSASIDDAYAGFPRPVSITDSFIVAGRICTPLKGAHVKPLPHMVADLEGKKERKKERKKEKRKRKKKKKKKKKKKVRNFQQIVVRIIDIYRFFT